MPLEYIDLPLELTSLILTELSASDLAALSCTCSYQRELVAPYLYRTVNFSNKASTAKSALAAVLRHARLVSALHFECRLRSKDLERNRSNAAEGVDLSELDDGDRSYHNHVPDAAAELLAHTPSNVSELKISFDFDLEDSGWSDLDLGFYAFETVESANTRLEGLEAEGWRRLVAETWNSVAKNRNIKKLEIEQLVPRVAAAYFTKGWECFLRQLSDLEITIMGLENGAGCQTNTMDGYTDHVTKLHEFFFQHCSSLTRLTLRASYHGPIGLTGTNHIPLPLKEDQLQSLQDLHLGGAFVGPELVSLIKSHVRKLKKLVLTDCLCQAPESSQGSAEDAISWADFFEQVLQAQPVITKLEILPLYQPLGSEEGYTKDYVPEESDESDDIQNVRKILQEDSTRRLFGYGYLDDQYGILCKDEEENVAAFERGEDQQAFNALMAFVARERPDA